MSLRNRLYRLQYRSVKNFNRPHFIKQSQQRQYQKQLHSIDTIMDIMYTAFKNNMKMQQIYLDLIKAHGRNIKIRGKQIRNVYQLLSENKTAQITFGKIYQAQEKQRKQRQQATLKIWTPRESNNCKTKDIMIATVSNILTKAITEQSQLSSLNTTQKKLPSTTKQSYQQLLEQQRKQQNYYNKILISNYKRLYSRLVEEITKKLTYYILNKNKLHQLIIYSILQITKRLQTILRRINDMKDNKLILDVVKLLFDQNMLLQKKIYEALVNEGHVVSIQEFFRVSGKMMEQPSQRKNSRHSVMSGNLSVISSISSENQNQQTEIKMNSRFNQHNKGLKKYKNHKTSQKIGFITNNIETQKQQKQIINITHIQKVHKEIQSKYASALDKISDLLVNNEQKIQQLQERIVQNKKENIKPEIDHSVQQNKHRSSQNSQTPFDRWKRQNEKRKTTAKKTISAFQYFSPQFKKVINQLDQKKGKVPLRVHNATETTPKFQQSLQKYSKINNETISFKNPLNVARLIGKRFKTIASSHFQYINKNRIMRNMARQKTQINNLIKMYQNDLKENQLVEKFMNKKGKTLNLNQQQLRFQKDVMQERLMKKIKQKKSTMIVSGNIGNKRMDEQLMKQIEDEYERLLKMKKDKSTQFDNDDIRDDFDISEDGCGETDMNNIDVEQGQRKINKVHLKDKQELNIHKYEKINKLFNTTRKSINRNERNQSKILNKSHSNKITLHQTHSPITTLNLTQTIQPLKLSNLQKIYNQFTNPLTSKYGFYHDEKYRSVRNSLQIRQMNAIKLKKCQYKKQDQFVVKKNVAFGQNDLNTSIEENKLYNCTSACNLLSKRSQRSSHPNLLGNKKSPSENLNNNFNLTLCHISTQKIQTSYPINSKDIEKYVQKCLQQNNHNTKNTLQQQKIQHFNKKLSTQKIQKNYQLRKIQSLRNTPRNSCGKRNQVYSTQRRMKIK